MTGVRHDSLADIGLISDNLRDRYKSGFPILKEIVQNSDDAGSTQLSFGYSLGLPDAQHELLIGPAVFFINDGPLSEENADAILSIALGSSASNENAIGKFGLGMKSLFHLCEAFFYISNQWDTGESYHSNIFNPWGDLRAQWESFKPRDKQLIEEYLTPVIAVLNAESKSKTWFIVWVPLRTRHFSYDGSIIENYPGDDHKAPDFILDETIDVKLGQLLPLLRNLKCISIWQPENLGLQCSSTIKISENAVRRQFQAPQIDSTLQGKILLASKNDKKQIDYAGYENLLSEDLFKTVRNSEFWPKSYERNRATGKEQKVEDKAKPHVAIVICQRKAKGSANSYSDWAVFLPLGSYPQAGRSNWVNSEDKYDTQIFIHGYFFIDAGRVHIYALDNIDKTLNVIENSDHVRSQWNSILATDGCLSHLPKAVNNFVIAHKCSAERTQHLSEAVFKSDFVNQHRKWISARYQWLYQLKADEKSWQLIDAGSIALALPSYPKDEQGRAWAVFPELTKLEDQGFVFFDQSHVALLNENNGGWRDELILQVLEVNIEKVFSDRTKFTYFNDFLDLDQVNRTEAISKKLMVIAKHGLTIDSKKWIKSELTRLLGFTPPGQRVVLSKVNLDGLWPKICKINTHLLIIPKDISPIIEKTTLLSVDDAYLLLEALDTVLGNAGSSKLHSEAQELVAEIMGLVNPGEKDRLLKRCTDFRLFKAHDLANKSDEFFTKSDFVRFVQQKKLFRFVSGLGDARFKLGRELLNALKNSHIYFTDIANKDLALGKQTDVPNCEGKFCLNYIHFNKPLLADTKHRNKLIIELSNLNELAVQEKRAFRYLLHGDLEHFENDEFLLTVATGLDVVWEKITRAIYKASGNDWRLIDQLLIDDLSNKLSNELNVRKLGIAEIIEALNLNVEKINFLNLGLGQKECDAILQESDENLWKKLPFHTEINGDKVSITEQCYLDNDIEIPSILDNEFSRIKRSKNPSIAKKQSQWIKPLDKKALLYIILSSSNRSNHYHIVLDHLDQHLLENTLDLVNKLKTSEWLINSAGMPIKPIDIIVIDGLDDEVKRLTTECQAGFYAPDDLHPDIRQHKAYETLKGLFSQEQEGLDSLLLMLGESKKYAIGTLALEVRELLSISSLVADDLNMPGWLLLANNKINSLLSNQNYSLKNPIEPLLKNLPIENYREILTNLIQIHEKAENVDNKKKIIKLFNAYLELLADEPNAIEFLKQIKLQNAKKRWVLADSLCWGIEGVDDDYLLDRNQAECLTYIIYSGVMRDIEMPTSGVVKNEDLLLQSTPNSLRSYFKEWSVFVENQLIGLFISLLGNQPEIVTAAGDYLGKRSIEGIRNKIIWNEKHSSGRDKVLFDGLNREESFDKMVFLIRPEDRDTIEVASIFNQPIKVGLHSHPKTIILDHRFLSPYKISFQLRKLNLNDWTESYLSELLKNSAEFILRTVYEQSGGLERIWNELSVSDQLDIEVAKGLILDELPANLRQLSLQQTEIHEYLKCFQNEKSKKKELELTNVSTGTVDKKITQLLTQMQQALINDTKAQNDILNAIKSKIGSHQYQSYSVPFEMFQNANDAVYEFAEMLAFPATDNILEEGELDTLQSKFQVSFDKEKVIFIHWGRAINYFRGSEGFPGKDRGFHRDLEKMLLMNTSDKQAENHVTGKFGLGFKSVYLISDRPKILSGRLGVEILAAMLPQPLQTDDRCRLQSEIEAVSNHSQLIATAIELPFIEGIEHETVLQRFICYAGILTAFSKCIKQISFNKNKSVSWHEQLLFDELPEIRKGRLMLADQQIDALKFTFKDEYKKYDLLFYIGATGFKNFPNKIEQEILPRIWILAPTVDESSVGFLINANFDVDTGRLQLAYESQNNEYIVRYLGEHFARILCQLNEMIIDDWPMVQQKLNLANDVKPYQLWLSLWQVLVSSWISKDDHKAHQLVRSMLTGSKLSFVSILSEKALIPNGLWGELQQLTMLADIKFTLKGVLSTESFFHQAIGQISEFITADALVHEKIQQELFRLLPEPDKEKLRWPTFDSVILADKSFANRRCDMECSLLWGQLLNTDLVQQFEKSEESQKERLQLEKLLAELEFLNDENKFKPVSDLLDERFSSEEEKLRAAFAPESCLLNHNYSEIGAYFFRFARPRLFTTIEELEYWALSANELNKQIGVLTYLLKGEHNDRLADVLRRQSSGTWLRSLNEASQHFSGWSKTDITTVLKRKLATDEEMDKLTINPAKNEQEEPLKPEIVLSNVYTWWSKNKDSYLKKYNHAIYPDGYCPNLLDGEEIDRNGWMILFFLGSLHTVGRTLDAQNRGAIIHFKNKGWWDIFVKDNPQNVPEQWMRVLDDYLEEQFYSSSYESWMMRFVTIYRFARWLDEYAASWLAIRQQSKKFNLADILDTASSHIHAGGGLSAPKTARTLGIGANFILRELVRNEMLSAASAIVSSEHCFVAPKRVRDLFNLLGMQLDEDSADIQNSSKIYEFISYYLGKENATFELCFDIPFQFIAKDIQLQQQLFNNNYINVEHVPSSELISAPSWAWDLLENVSFFVALVSNHQLPEPIVGYDLGDSDGVVLLQLELAWNLNKVGILVGDVYDVWNEFKLAQNLGWQIFTVEELEEQEELNRFLVCFQQ